MRVLHLLNSLQPSGMERMLCSASGELSSKGVISLVVGQGPSHPYRSILESHGLSVRTIPKLRTRAGRKAYRKLLRAFKPDIVHLHTEGFYAPTVLETRRGAPDARIVRTIHNVFQNSGRARFSRRLQAKIADRFVAVFVAPSPDVVDNETQYSRACRLVFNWVDDRYFRITSDRTRANRQAAVIVGNSSPIKNQIVALEAVNAVGIELFMYGDESGAISGESQLLDKLERQGHLRHRGVGDPVDGFSRSTIFLMPSLHEGMGVALAEALVSGLFCFVSDAPGLTWAQGLQRVRVVRGGAKNWTHAVRSYIETATVTGDLETGRPLPDFSAARGVDEYISVYRDALRAPASSGAFPFGIRGVAREW